MLGRERRILAAVARGRQSDEPRAGELGQAAGERRMIRVRVSHDDLTNARAGRRQNGFQVPCIVGPRIEHRHVADSEQVGVGTGSRHQARIAGHDAANVGRQRHALLGNELRSGFG